jgi:hypothetical protein
VLVPFSSALNDSPAVAVECLSPQHSAAAVVRQSTHRGVTSDTAVDYGKVQEDDLALLNATAAAGLCSAQQALCISDVGAQTSTRTPTVLCGGVWGEGGRQAGQVGRMIMSFEERNCVIDVGGWGCGGGGA